MEWGCTLPAKVSSIQVFHLSGVLLDKLFARLYLVAHQRGEKLISHRRRLDRDLEHRPVLRVHRRLPELLRVHLREALEAGDTGVSVGPDAVQRLSQLGVVFGVVLAAVVRNLVERRKGDVDVAGLDQVPHVAIQERQHQRSNVASVHVGVGHDDDLVVAHLLEIEALPHPGAYRADQGLYLGVGEDLVDVGLLHVEDLAPQRQDGLEVSVPPAFGRSAGRVALDDVELAPGRVLGRAVGELARQRRALQVALADLLPHRPGREPGPRSLQRLVDYGLGLTRMLLQKLGKITVGHALHETLDLRVPELGLGLSLELGLLQLDGDDRGQSLPDVVAGKALLFLLEKTFLPGVGVDRPRQRRPETGEVRATFVRVDVVGEREDGVLEAAVPLHRDLYVPYLLLTLQVEDGFVDGVFRLVDVLHEVPYAALVLICDVPGFFPLVYEPDLESLVQESPLAEPAAQGIEREVLGLGKDLRVGQEAYGGARPLALLELTVLCQSALRKPALVALAPHVSLDFDLQLEPLGERIHHGGADAVQSAGHLVTFPAELPAGVQRRHDDLGRRLAVLRHLAHRHTAPVVGDRDGVVRVDRYEYLRTVPGQGLVYGVVDDLPDEVVKTPGARRADVHTRAPLDGFEAFEDLNGTCIVSALGILDRGLSRQRTGPSSWSVRRRRRRCSFHRNSAPDDCNTFAAVSKQHFGPFAAYLSRFRRFALTPGTIRCGLQDGTTRYAYDTGSSQDLFVEIFEVGRRDHGLRALQKVPSQILPPPFVEFAHHVVEEQDRVLPHSPPHVVPRCELQRQRRDPLLPLGPEGGQVYPA